MRQQINSKFDLVQYCLRKLGAPVIQINVTEQQIDDRINDTIDMFTNFHMDGSYRQVHVHVVTAEDIAAQKVILPETILSVISVYLQSDPGINSLSSGTNIQMQAYFSDMISNTFNNGSIASFALTQSYFNTLSSMLPNGIMRVNSYHIYENELTIPSFKWSTAVPGSLIGLDCFKFNDPDEVGKVYNDYWIKQYATAQLKLQWANNLSKFTNIQLPGGGTLNGESLMIQAQQEITELEQKLKDQYAYPIEAFMF